MPPISNGSPDTRGLQNNNDGSIQRKQDAPYTKVSNDLLTTVPAVMPLGLPVNQQHTKDSIFYSRSNSNEHLTRPVSPLPLTFGLTEQSSSYNTQLTNIHPESIAQNALRQDFDRKQQQVAYGSNDQSTSSLVADTPGVPQLNNVVNQIDTKSNLFMPSQQAYYDNQQQYLPQQSQSQSLSSHLSPVVLASDTNIPTRRAMEQNRPQSQENTQIQTQAAQAQAQVQAQLQAQAQARSYQTQLSSNGMFDGGDSVAAAPMGYSGDQRSYLSLPYSQDRYQQSPLMRPLQVPPSPVVSDELTSAVKAGNIDLVANLIRTGVNIDNKDTKGWTAMHWAAATGNIDCVALLCRAGANIQSKSYSSKTAMDLAKLRGHYTIVELLTYGSKVQQPMSHIDSPNLQSNWNIDLNGIIQPVEGMGTDSALLSSTRSASVPVNTNINHMDMSDGISSTEGLGRLGNNLGSGNINGGYSDEHAVASHQPSLHLVDNPRERRLSPIAYDSLGLVSSNGFGGMRRSTTGNAYYDSDAEVREATQLQQSYLNCGKVEWSPPVDDGLVSTTKMKRRKHRSIQTSVSTGCIDDSPTAKLQTSRFSASHLGDTGNSKDSQTSLQFFHGDGQDDNSLSAGVTSGGGELSPTYGAEGCSCVECGTRNTPQWRKGPSGPRTLCNACGLKHLHSQQRERMNARRRELYMKSKKKKEEAARQAALEAAQYGEIAGRRSNPNDVSSGSQGMA